MLDASPVPTLDELHALNPLQQPAYADADAVSDVIAIRDQLVTKVACLAGKAPRLHRIDVAFSRDAPQKVYVQDRMWDKRRDLVDWVDGGAKFYVCGDAKNMAKDVRAAVVKAYETVKNLSAADAETQVAALERSHRYQQDVY